MFLVGVFLNDLKPSGWPPTALDFTNDGYTTLEPDRTDLLYSTGAGKRIMVPHDATRVFLGYARSDLMIGTAGWYQQGGGSLTAAIDLTAGARPGVSPVQVDAKSNLYAAGRETAFDGYLPPMVRLNPGPGKVLTVPQVTGRVRCCGGGYTTADGASDEVPNAYRGLSGIWAKWRGYFLAGVFLDDNVADGAPPEKLVFTEPFDFRSLAPVIGQVFPIGDGVTTAGVPHEFAIPATATRLYLGFAMGRLFAAIPDTTGKPAPLHGDVEHRRRYRLPACRYALSETARSMAAGGTGTVTVTTASGCAVDRRERGVVDHGDSRRDGSGPGAVGYTVAANTGAARTGADDRRPDVDHQPGGGSPGVHLRDHSRDPDRGGGRRTLTVQVTAAAGCAWTAASNATWLTVTAGASGRATGR